MGDRTDPSNEGREALLPAATLSHLEQEGMLVSPDGQPSDQTGRARWQLTGVGEAASLSFLSRWGPRVPTRSDAASGDYDEDADSSGA